MRLTTTSWSAGLALVVLLGACDSGSAAPPTPDVSSSARPIVTRDHPAPPPRVDAHRVASLPAGLSRTVAVRRGGDILLLGGLTSGDVTTGRIWRFDPRSGRTAQSGSLTEPVHDASGALLDGAALVFGGGAATEVADVQAWSANRDRVVGRLPAGRSDSAAAVVDGTAYVLGGFDGSRLLRDVLATRNGRTVRVAGRLRQGVRYPAVAAVGGAVFVVGGELATTAGTTGGPQSDAIQRFDPSTGRTTVVGHLPHPLGHAMAFVLGGRLFVAGGLRSSTATDRVWSVDPQSGRVRAAGRLPQPLSDAAVVPVDDAVWLLGGERTGPLAPLRSVLRIRVSR